MSQIEVLEYVRDFADRSHGTQVRKYTGERYIGHPLRVMETVRKYRDEVPVLAAALMHDVLEDTPVTQEEIGNALIAALNPTEAAKALMLVVELTDVFVKEDYPRLNRRSRKEKEALRLSGVSSDAQTIKYADIIDNVTDIVKQDVDFAKVYVREAKKMLLLMEAGHPGLRARAMQIVDEYLQGIKNAATLR